MKKKTEWFMQPVIAWNKRSTRSPGSDDIFVVRRVLAHPLTSKINKQPQVGDLIWAASLDLDFGGYPRDRLLSAAIRTNSKIMLKIAKELKKDGPGSAYGFYSMSPYLVKTVDSCGVTCSGFGRKLRFNQDVYVFYDEEEEKRMRRRWQGRFLPKRFIDCEIWK